MTQTAMGVRSSGDLDWPARPPDADMTLADGRLGLLERYDRTQGVVRLYWQPPSASRFWSERGRLSTVVRAALESPLIDHRGLVAELEELGVAVQVGETDFFCQVDLAGGSEELIGCAEHVADVLGKRSVASDAISAAGRKFGQERSAYHHRLLGISEVQQWRNYVVTPLRLWCDYAPEDRPGGCPTILHDRWWPVLDRVIVVGPRRLAAAWAAAVDALSPCVTISDGPPGVALKRPPQVTVLPARKRSQCLTRYGAVDLANDVGQLFDIELAVELLAGWPGSLLNKLFRHELAWCYGVAAEIGIASVGDRKILNWSIFLQTAPERARSVMTKITDQVRFVLDKCPADAEIRRAAQRILRREQLCEDSVADIMHRQGANIQSNMPTLAGLRWQHFKEAGTDNLTRAMERMLHLGTFILVGNAGFEPNTDGDGD